MTDVLIFFQQIFLSIPLYPDRHIYCFGVKKHPFIVLVVSEMDHSGGNMILYTKSKERCHTKENAIRSRRKKKKCLLLLLAVLMCASVIPLIFDSDEGDAALLEEFTIGEIKYTVLTENPNTVEVTSVTYQFAGDKIIPTTVATGIWRYTVTSIGDAAFYQCTGLTSIVIPNSVTNIGVAAFSGCSGLVSVTMYNSVMTIGEQAFFNCSSLTLVTISNSVKNISPGTFYGCSSLVSVTIPGSVTSIGEATFDGCSSLTSIIIPNSVTSIGEAIFNNCSKLSSVVMSTSVKSIERFAFANCSSLTAIIIPNSVTSIKYYAFANCSSLTSITIPDSVTSIGEAAFNTCSSLTSVAMSNSVKIIENGLFYDCSKLVSINISSSATSIGDYAFSYCSSLTSVTIPNSVTSMGAYAFSDCSSLTSVTIPNSVKNIGEAAFIECFELASITIPNSLTSIGENSFYNCPKLTIVAVPKDLDISNTFLAGIRIVRYTPSHDMQDIRFGVNAVINNNTVTLTYIGNGNDRISFMSNDVIISSPSNTFIWPGRNVNIDVDFKTDYSVSLSVIGSGVIMYSVDGNTFQTYDLSQGDIIVEAGKNLYLKAVPSSGNKFSTWEGSVHPDDLSKDYITLAVDGEISLTAKFKQDTPATNITEIIQSIVASIVSILQWLFKLF